MGFTGHRHEAAMRWRCTMMVLAGALAPASIGVAQSPYPANEIYRPRPNEAYNSDTYCLWNRTGLPDQFQKICAARDRKHPPPKPKWVSVEADNGAVTKVDMNSIQRGNGAAIIFTYADEGRPEDAYNLQGYMFDCQGHYELMGLQSSRSFYAPPRSVAAKISELACAAPIGTIPR